MDKMIWCRLCLFVIFSFVLFPGAGICQKINCDSLNVMDSSRNSPDSVTCLVAKNQRGLAEIKDSTKSLNQYMQTLANYNDHLAVQLRVSDSLWNLSYKEDCRLIVGTSFSSLMKWKPPFRDPDKLLAEARCEDSYITDRSHYLSVLSFTIHCFELELKPAKKPLKKIRRNKK